MGKTIGHFDYKLIGAGPARPGVPNIYPWVEIFVKQYMTGAENGSPVVSPDLMSDGEIDGHIKALKADLDAVGVKAKRALHAALNK